VKEVVIDEIARTKAKRPNLTQTPNIKELIDV